MKRYLLDTNICVYILRGVYPFVNHMVTFKECCISEMTVAELKYGQEYGMLKAPKQYRKQDLGKFFQAIRIIPIHSAIDLYAKEKARLRHSGTPIGDDFDLLIGCSAVANRLILVTENTKDFIRINNIKLENWVDDYRKTLS